MDIINLNMVKFFSLDMINIGFIQPEGGNVEILARAAGRPAGRLPDTCPRCSQPSLIHQEGCNLCTSCGFSKCA